MYRRKMREWGLVNKYKKRQIPIKVDNPDSQAGLLNEASIVQQEDSDLSSQSIEVPSEGASLLFASPTVDAVQPSFSSGFVDLLARKTALYSPPLTPKIFQGLEFVLYNIRSYVHGSSNQQRDLLVGDKAGCGDVQFCQNLSELYESSMAVGEIREPGVHLDLKAMNRSLNASLYRLLGSGHPETLNALLVILMKGQPRMICILESFASAAHRVVSQSHPIYKILNRFQMIRKDRLKRFVATAWECLLDVFESMLDDQTVQSLHSRLNYLMCVEKERNPEGTEKVLRKLVYQNQMTHGPNSLVVLKCQRALGLSLIEINQFDEAIELAEKMLWISRETGSQPAAAVTDCYSMMYTVHLHRRNTGAAELCLWKAIENDVAIYGWQSSIISYKIVLMERLLRENGVSRLADMVEEQRVMIAENAQ